MSIKNKITFFLVFLILAGCSKNPSELGRCGLNAGPTASEEASHRIEREKNKRDWNTKSKETPAPVPGSSK